MLFDDDKQFGFLTSLRVSRQSRVVGVHESYRRRVNTKTRVWESSGRTLLKGNPPTPKFADPIRTTGQGWLYLAVVIDLFSRQVVGRSTGKRINKELVIDAFKMAYWRRRPDPGLIFHSDRGSQYCSTAFQKTLKLCDAITA